MPDHPPLPDAFDGALAKTFWDEVPPRASATIRRQLQADGRLLTAEEQWLIGGGAIGGALHAVMWLADHDLIKDCPPTPATEET